MLSLAGRSILIQASLAVIPSYVMQCTHQPGRILDGLDRVYRNFLLGIDGVSQEDSLGWME